MYITIDTSAIIAVVGNEKTKDRIIEVTNGVSLYAPMSVHWEVGNAFSAMFKRHKASIEQAKSALAIYREIPIKFIDVPLEQSLEISHSLNIYSYDAYLIQCAQQTSTSLLTLDRGLRSVAEKTGLHIIEV